MQSALVYGFKLAVKVTSLTMKGALACLFVLGLTASALSSNSDPSEAPAICAADRSDGILVAHEECDKFFKCSEGLPVALSCPAGLLWNADQEICDWSENVKCDSGDKFIEAESAATSKPKGNTDPSEAPEICSAEGSDGILVAHEECDKFYKCFKGQPVALSCPPNLQWNADKEICDWAENVNCKANAKENVSPCALQPSGTLMPHEKCNEFYLCNQGINFALTCPDNLNYDAEKKICNWPDQVNCGDRT